MQKNYFQRRKILKSANYLDLTPVKVSQSMVAETGLISLLIPRFTNPFLIQMVPKRKENSIKIKLDEFGSNTWENIDGQKNVRKICEELTANFGDKVQPVYDRVPKFLTTLYEQRFISFKELEKEK